MHATLIILTEFSYWDDRYKCTKFYSETFNELYVAAEP